MTELLAPLPRTLPFDKAVLPTPRQFERMAKKAREAAASHADFAAKHSALATPAPAAEAHEEPVAHEGPSPEEHATAAKTHDAAAKAHEELAKVYDQGDKVDPRDRAKAEQAAGRMIPDAVGIEYQRHAWLERTGGKSKLAGCVCPQCVANRAHKKRIADGLAKLKAAAAARRGARRR